MAATVDGRVKDIERAAEAFRSHLTTVPGPVLSPTLRLFITRCCAQAPIHNDREQPLPPGVALTDKVGISTYFAWIERGHQVGAWDRFCGEDADSPLVRAPLQDLVNLKRLVHDIVLRPTSLDQGWYDAALDSIRSLEAVDVDDQEDDKDSLRIDSAFCEIIILTAVSHGINVIFFGLGREPPLLPSWSEVRHVQGPSNVRLASILRRVRRNSALCRTPYYYWWDVDSKSPEFTKLAASTRQCLWTYTVVPNLPWTGCCLSPDDLILFRRFMHLTYIQMREVLMPWTELSSDRRCASVCRYDLECVAAALSESRQCDY